jgi:hypothetical protein
MNLTRRIHFRKGKKNKEKIKRKDLKVKIDNSKSRNKDNKWFNICKIDKSVVCLCKIDKSVVCLYKIFDFFIETLY